MDAEIRRLFRKSHGEIHFHRLETGVRGAQTRVASFALQKSVGKVNNQMARCYSKINCYQALSHPYEFFFFKGHEVGPVILSVLLDTGTA